MPRAKMHASGASNAAVRASSMWLMRVTWVQVLLLPLPAYLVELWIARRYSGVELGLYAEVGTFGVGWEVAIFAAAILGAASIAPRLAHRRAMRRLRLRARAELSSGRGGRYRAAPPLVLRFPAEDAALEMAAARYATRLCAALGLLAILDLRIFFAMVPWKGFPCVDSPTVYVPSAPQHLLLVGLVVAVAALELPRRAAIVGPIDDIVAR